MISGIIAYKAQFEKVTDFTIMFSSELLKSVDKAVYDLLNDLYGLQIKQKVFNPNIAFDG